MKNHVRKFAQLLLLGLGAMACSVGMHSIAHADSYPSKEIRFVVPYPPGSVTDLLARTIGQKMTETWQQPVIVENKAGGGSVIGTDVVARADPDGYTILLVAPDLAINQSLRSKLPYDAQKDFAAVSLLVNSPMVLAVNPSLPVNSVQEMLNHVKSRPGKLSYASGGNGTVAHLGMELLKDMAGVDLVHVPYKGTASVVRALVANEIPLAFAQMSTVRPQQIEGKLRILAIASGERSQAMPDVPTVAEAGVPGFRADVWFGVVAPAGTPAPVIAKLNNEIRRIMNLPDVKERLAPQGIETHTTTPQEFTSYIKSEIGKWEKIVKKTGAQVD
jgi:tripartite-type tricarboxylate transporter receptor subunit TctC